MSSWEVDTERLNELVRSRDAGSKEQLEDSWGGLQGLSQMLRTDLQNGISLEEVESEFEARKLQFGDNIIPQKPPTPYLEFLKEAMSDRTLQILLAASIVSLILGLTFPPKGEDRSTSWIEGFTIFLAVVVISNVTAANDYSKDRKFRKLAEISEDRKVKVIRGEEQKTVSINTIVVGDIVHLETGDFIPADMVLIEGQGLHSDESAMTGEPDAVLKNEDNPWLLSGCTITEGVGKGIVVATGVNSQWGQIKTAVDSEQRATPLQEKLEVLADNIGKGGLLFAILTLVALLIRWGVLTWHQQKKPWFQLSYFSEWVEFVIISITIVAVAIPEGLPLAVTLSLAFSMFQMMKDQNLVRHLVACETMGGATNICSDKTGTLTQNRMTVVRIWTSGSVIQEPPKDTSAFHPYQLATINEGICVNSSAYIQNRRSERPEFIGLKTECALLVMADDLGSDYEKVRKDAQIERMWPFSSKNKRMTTIIKSQNSLRLYCKGASEVVLKLCTRFVDADGQVRDLDDSVVRLCDGIIESWASQGLRTLTLAHSDLPSYTQVPKDGPCTFENNLILDCIVGIADPLRPEVANSIRLCKKAGITVRMLTGDNILTAKYIGQQCGILTDGGEAMEGPTFRDLTQEQMDEVIPRLQIIARCSPDDKLRLVKRLIELGEVVAVTGDGTNDVPALSEADVGFAMGISGTEVAKDACDIILMDDNFSSIEKAVMWGRGVYDSIQKFLQFQLTVNIVAVVIAFVGAVSDGDSPLKAVQLLWVNLIMDTLAALALATERPGPEMFDRPPHGRYSNLITFKMWRQILVHAAFQITVLLVLFYHIDDIEFLETNRYMDPDPDRAEYLFEVKRSTIIFNAFVWCQIFNEFNARKLVDELNMFDRIHKSHIFMGVFAFTAVVQFLMVQFGGEAAKTMPLNLTTWIFCVGIGSIALPLGFITRFVPVPKEKSGKTSVSEEGQSLLGGGLLSDDVSPPPSPRGEQNSHPMVNLDKISTIALRRHPHQNWSIARRVLTQVRVISSFKRSLPHKISGTAPSPRMVHNRSFN
eukprot:TRINITY_DN8_c0_g2_i1.p1 TRINITY_DN8_c0_g2~~TRINITY_DN8_c0_g2_i1.p1  ORF type:complete len:1045 (-),score=339.09 TRINITY_DN8_c0_g2_i1:59-3193(-)